MRYHYVTMVGIVSLFTTLSVEAQQLTTRELEKEEVMRKAAGAPLAAAEVESQTRGVYQNFERLSKQSGTPVTFEIQSVEIYEKAQFDDIQWFQLFTANPEKAIYTLPMADGGDLPSQSRPSYPSKWEPVDAADMANAGKVEAEFGGVSVSEALKTIAETMVLPEITHVSSVSLAVELGGTRYEYRSAFVWGRLSADETWVCTVDMVVPALGVTVSDGRDAVTEEELQNPPRENPNPATEADNCLVVTGGLTEVGPATNVNLNSGHLISQHELHFRGKKNCSTTRQCDSRCAISVHTFLCRENPVSILLCPACVHKRFQRVQTDTVDGIGMGNQASCGVAVGCAIKSCPFFACGGVSFSVTGSGSTLKVTSASAVLDDMSTKWGTGYPGAHEAICSGESIATWSTTMGADETEFGPVFDAAGHVLRNTVPTDETWHGMSVTYVMPDWAVLEWDEYGVLEISQGNSAELTNRLALDHPTAEPNTAALVVAVPEHPANSRAIVTPELHFEEFSTRRSAKGSIFVQAVFDDTETLTHLEFLHHDLPGGIPERMSASIENAIGLGDRISEHGHRVVAFAKLEAGGGRVKLGPHTELEPSCCCDGGICCPEPPCGTQ